MMGKLFWKFFFGFWLCLVIAIAVSSGIFHVWHEHDRQKSSDLAEGPRSQFLLEMAREVLEGKGPASLRHLLDRGKNRTGQLAPVFVVSEEGTELLNRQIPPLILEKIHAFKLKGFSSSEGIIQVTAADHSRWFLFILKPFRINSVPQSPNLFDGKPPFLESEAVTDTLSGGPSPKGSPQRLFGLFFLPFPPIGILIALLASVLFAGGLAYRFSSPLRKLKRAFEQAGQGELGVRIATNLSRTDEMGQLLKGFDHMASQIEKHIQQHQALLHDVSHELRSPLARLNIAAGLARQNPKELDKNLDRIERESQRLDCLIGELLDLSRLDNAFNLQCCPIYNVIELLESVVDDAQFEASSHNRKVELVGYITHWNSRCDAEALQRAFENILRNAIRYTPEGTCVKVAYQEMKPEQLQISITDEGLGVPTEMLDRLFIPFFKMGPLSGNGLGLAIVKKTIELHKGGVKIDNIQPHGLQVCLTLPKLF